MHFADWLTLGVAAILTGLMMYGRVVIWRTYTDGDNPQPLLKDVPDC